LGFSGLGFSGLGFSGLGFSGRRSRSPAWSAIESTDGIEVTAERRRIESEGIGDR
jgi:hypothetical protein